MLKKSDAYNKKDNKINLKLASIINLWFWNNPMNRHLQWIFYYFPNKIF